jgi:hypothetical protein
METPNGKTKFDGDFIKRNILKKGRGMHGKPYALLLTSRNKFTGGLNSTTIFAHA